jgi:hypothetical protein
MSERDNDNEGPSAELQHARERWRQARRAVTRKAAEQRAAEQRAQWVVRHASSEAEKADALLAAEAASAAHGAAAEELRALGKALPGLVEAQLPVTPQDEVARLDARWPIVLMPVRMETRFRGRLLLLRIYPDDLFAESHEDELTADEIAAGRRFWLSAWPDEAAERAAWKTLVDELGAPRAAWVAQEMTPTNAANQRPGTPPDFPNPAQRAASWTRAAQAHLLPDRWVVMGYRSPRDPNPIVEVGSAIVEPLAMTFAPDSDESAASPLGDDGLKIDDAVRWTVDFAAAKRAGMALQIDLDAADAARGFARLLVFGVKGSLSPTLSAEALAALLRQHRYDRGVAVVPQGTVTNNSSAGGATGFPLPDPEGRLSFDALRRGLAPAGSADGPRLMAALGLPPAEALHLFGADGDGQSPAAAMARALWPTTLGYFLEQLMAPIFTPAAIRDVQRHFVDHVRGRGSLPAFRIGNTPYGVLPVSSLARWQARNPKDGFERELITALRRLQPLWLARIGDVPRIGRSDDPDGDLLAVLGMDASTREVRVRAVLGEETQWNLFGLFGFGDAWPGWQAQGEALAARVFTRLGHPDWRPRVARFNYGSGWVLPDPLVADAPLSERDGLSPNYIEWIAKASVPELDAQALPAGAPKALLYRLLRHAALLEYHDASFALLARFGRLEGNERFEAELTGSLPGKGLRMARSERWAQVLPEVSTQALQSFLAEPDNDARLRGLLPEGEVVDLRAALATLAPLPTAELDRLCGETLDVVAHRLDAWITSLPAQRLAQMRAGGKSAGCHLGAFGWVEDLRPKSGISVETLPDGRQVMRQADNGGFVHAPSMMHAATAAVLRNAHQSRRGAEQERYAVDLSSARVRLGRSILDAVREGQPLGAVFGYRVERGLHERRQDRWIAPLRAAYPLVANKGNDPAAANEPTEQIAARNVVDGMALYKAHREGTGPKGIRWGEGGLPAGGEGRAAIEAELALLETTADAVGDLVFAESIHQLVKGSPQVAAASLDAMASGKVRPPDPEVATQPRGGTPLTHRVALVLGGAMSALPAGWPAEAEATLRAHTEPALDRWLGHLFGDATRVSCSVEVVPASGPVRTTPVTLQQLKLRPIDVLALTRAPAKKDAAAGHAGKSELDRRIQEAAFATLRITQEAETRINYELAANVDRRVQRSFADILEVARAVEALLADKEPLAPADLLAEDSAGQTAGADLMPAETRGRAEALKTAIADVAQPFAGLIAAAQAVADSAPIDLTALRAQLRAAAAAGAKGAFPATSHSIEPSARRELIAQALSAKKELEERLKTAQPEIDAATAAEAADPAACVRHARAAVSQLLGADMPFLPRFKPAAADELGNALGHATSANFIAAGEYQRLREIRRFERIAARVRPVVDAWRRQELLTTVLGRPAAPRIVAQLPYEDQARWVARPFSAEAQRPKAGRTSVLMYRFGAPAATESWSGLLLDAWSELIPSSSEQTAVALHYDATAAEAAQALLVAVPPDPSATRWDLGALVDTLNETLDLAKIRAVDGELLGELGQLLPAIYLSDSTDAVTIRTSFAGMLRRERVIKTRVGGE